MKLMDDLIKKYKFDAADVKTLEKMTESAMSEAMSKRIEFFELLSLWEKTGRFRENKQYKNATFEQYLWGRYMMRIPEYHRERIALLQFPEETEEFGASTVVEVKRKCGVVTAPKVFKEFQKEKQNQKVNHLEPQKTAEIIRKHELPKALHVVGPPKTSLAEIRLKEEVQTMNKEIAELKNQITKLKITIETLRGMERGTA